MDKRKTRRRAAEGIKSALIVLLAVSAVYLALRTQLFEEALNTGGDDGISQLLPTAGGSGESGSATVRPVRMAVMSDTGRYGVQYSDEETDALFSRTASLLVEALGSAGVPREVTRQEWEDALGRTSSICFDFLGALPFENLQAWLSVGQGTTSLSGSARRLALSPGEDDGVLLYYINEEDGLYYACSADVLRQSQLHTAVSGLGGNGARFAFETEEYAGLDPDTLLLQKPPAMPCYASADPLAGETGDAIRLEIAEALRFRVQGNTTYSGADGMVIKSGGDTLRMGQSGVVTYESDGQTAPLFPVSSTRIPDVLDAAWAVLTETVLPYSGEGRLYLRQVETGEDGTVELCFDYSLSGAEVTLGTGLCAAHFVAEDHQITHFTLYLRTYTATGETDTALPELQAQAAAAALGAEQPELRMRYQDSLTEPVRAGWIAG